ncbi:hypothetical protein JL720_756 [Aureococcus anophagefferens]|nr:hypothetical protein JL720_756 [Aureococcus anophagefferens]
MEPAEPGSGADNEPDDALVAAPDEAEALRPDDELEALYTCTPNALSAPEAALDPDADAYAALNLEDAEKEILRQVARDEVEARLEDCGAEDVALASLYAECRRYEAIERERVSSILRGLRSQGAALREMMDAHRGPLRLLATLAVVRARGFDDGAAAVAAGCEVLSSVRLDGTRVGDAGVAALAAGCGRRRHAAVVARAASHLGDVGVAAVARVCAPRAPGGAAASLPAELAFLERRRDAGGRLTSLDLSRHGKLTDEGVLSVAGGLGRRLRHLVLNRCGNVTDLSPVAVADACADLESLGLEVVLESNFNTSEMNSTSPERREKIAAANGVAPGAVAATPSNAAKPPKAPGSAAKRSAHKEQSAQLEVSSRRSAAKAEGRPPSRGMDEVECMLYVKPSDGGDAAPQVMTLGGDEPPADGASFAASSDGAPSVGLPAPSEAPAADEAAPVEVDAGAAKAAPPVVAPPAVAAA